VILKFLNQTNEMANQNYELLIKSTEKNEWHFKEKQSNYLIDLTRWGCRHLVVKVWYLHLHKFLRKKTPVRLHTAL